MTNDTTRTYAQERLSCFLSWSERHLSHLSDLPSHATPIAIEIWQSARCRCQIDRPIRARTQRILFDREMIIALSKIYGTSVDIDEARIQALWKIIEIDASAPRLGEAIDWLDPRSWSIWDQIHNTDEARFAIDIGAKAMIAQVKGIEDSSKSRRTGAIPILPRREDI